MNLDIDEEFRSALQSIGVPLRDRARRQLSDFPRLWHYTDAKGLVGILAEQTIRATRTDYLKDLCELKYGTELIRCESKRFLQSKPGLRELINTAIETTNCIRPKHRFVSSFCTKEDDPGQWREYGDAGRGFAIEFRTDMLYGLTPIREHPRNVFVDLLPVVYDSG